MKKQYQTRKLQLKNMIEKTIETKISVYKFEELSAEFQMLIERAKEQVINAYAPYSEFHVGAAVQLENDEIFTGSNQENSAYPSGLCAERVAMFYANSQYPRVPVKTLAIAAFTKGSFLADPVTPCGSCRQVLLETETRFEKDITILLYGTEYVYKINNVKQLLPLCFEKSSLSR
ncbi:MAG: cytidine deaminase [Paludibacter sp.]